MLYSEIIAVLISIPNT